MARQTERQRQSRRISRTKAKQKRMKAFRRTVLLPIAIIVVFAAGITGIKLHSSGWFSEKWHGIIESTHDVIAGSGFKMQRVTIIGRKKTSKNKVLSAIGVDLGESIWKLSPDNIRRRIESLSSVRKAEVKRMLPGYLNITIKERTPAAIWQYKGRLKVIDIEGEILADESYKDYPELLVIVGRDAPEHLEELFSILASKEDLANYIIAAVRVGGRRWNFETSSSITIQMPEENIEHAWKYLADTYQSHKILQKAISRIDLRMGDRIFIKVDKDAKNKSHLNNRHSVGAET